MGAIGYPERQNTFDRLPARSPNRGRDSSCTLADASSDRSPCRAQFGNNQATPELILSSYELHGCHGRSTYLMPQRWNGRGRLAAVASTDLTPLFVPLLVPAHNLSVWNV